MRHMFWLVGEVSLVAVTAAPARAQMGPMHDWGYGWGLPWSGPFGLVIFALVIIGLVTVLGWLLGGKNRDVSSRSSAMAILEERYARGEINHEDFEQRRRDLAG